MKNWYKIELGDLITEAKEIWTHVCDNIHEDNPVIKHMRKPNPYFTHVNLGVQSKQWSYFRELFNEITDEPCLLEFYVAEPHNYVANPHTDRGRSVAINIPVQVNLEKSDAYFGKYTNLDDYQHTSNYEPYTFKLIDSKGKAKQEINQHFRGKYQAELYDSVNFDKSVVFNPAMPHGGYNNSDEIRVLLSLSWFNTSFEEFTSKAKDLGYIL
jgi:hypothetical protein